MNKRKVLCACLLAMAAAPGLSSADILGSTTILRGMHYTLYDLDPNDGVTPSLTFDPTPYERAMWSSVSAEWVQNGRWGGSTHQEGWPDHAGNPLSLVTEGNAYRSSVDLNGRADVATLSLASSNEIHMDKNVLRRAYSSVQGDPYSFTLSANTRVVFGGEMITSASIQGQKGLGQWYNVNGQIYLWLYEAFPNNPPTFHDYYGGTYGYHHLFTTEDQLVQLNETSPVELEFSNTTNTSLNGGVRFNMDTNAGGQLTAIPVVPEPESYLMFAAGLGLFSLVTRRRT
ncbi:PEP-CTERM sorting domain-containing protein [Pseudoduganella sp. UC29_106]|uniref:PEP-CTERM sorting domain-containing protein n=1 Tax=Pseudoduganella sp. UC29_106 TaxID=3374553 RepID=UPI003756E6EE